MASGSSSQPLEKEAPAVWMPRCEAGGVPVDSRAARGSKDLQLHDVVKLAHHFGVSVLSALYRFLNLKLVTDKQFQEMKQMDTDGVSLAVAESLALEAYRREKISRRKLVEIGNKLGVPASEIDLILAKLDLDDNEPSEVLLPAN
jgi:hypothetical protein